MSFEDIRVGDTIILAPNLNKKASFIYQYCFKKCVKQMTALVIGKLYDTTIAVVDPEHICNLELTEHYIKLYSIPEKYALIYRGLYFFGVGAEQCESAVTIISSSNFNCFSFNEDNGGFSLL